MTTWKKAISLVASATLLASLLATTVVGTAFATSATTNPTTVVPANGLPTTISIGTITGVATTDITAGTVTLTLSAGYNWITAPTLTASNITSAACATGGSTTATCVLSAPAAAPAVATLAFSGGVVRDASTVGTGTVTASGGTAFPTGFAVSGVVATLNSTALTCTNGPYGTAFPYCANVLTRPADGTSYIQLGFFAGSAPAATLITVTATGSQFIGGLGDFAALTYPRTSIVLATNAIAAGSQLYLASNVAGTATVAISYSTGTTTPDSNQSFTFTSASVNVPSIGLSTSNIFSAGVMVSSPASAPKAAGTTTLYMEASAKDNNGAIIAAGVSAVWTISGPAYFVGGSYTSTVATNGAGIADSPLIVSTGAGGTATVTSTLTYLGVSYALPNKTINFVGVPATITCSNGYFSIPTGTSQQGVDDGAIECNVMDANNFNITTGVAFTSVSPTPAAYWTTSGVNSWSTNLTDWEVGATCGSIAGTASAKIQATVGTTSVTTTAPITLTCATALTTVNLGTLTLDVSAGTSVQVGGQLPILVTVKDKNGLPAPDGTVITAATNGFGTVVRVTNNTASKGTVNGISKFLYLAPSTPGTAVVTFFGQGVTTPANVSVTITVGAGVTVTPFPWHPTTSALGNTMVGPFSFSTKIQAIGRYITWKVDGGSALANQTIQVWVYKKYSPLGHWTGPMLLTTRHANASGVAYINVFTRGILWLSLRPVLPATATAVASWGPTSIGRWR